MAFLDCLRALSLLVSFVMSLRYSKLVLIGLALGLDLVDSMAFISLDMLVDSVGIVEDVIFSCGLDLGFTAS